MKSNYLFIILALLCISLISANAVSAELDINTYTTSKDFTVLTYSDKLSICSCSSTSDFITVKNTGSFGAIFTVDVNSGIKYSLPEKNFELAPGESKNVYIMYNADCNKKNTRTEITITSNLGVSKKVSKNVLVDRCQNIEMWIDDDEKTVKSCRDATYTIFVKNTGPFTDVYGLSSDYPVKFTATSFELKPNQMALINSSINLGCGVSGDRNITFYARSLNNKLQSSSTVALHILPDYDYDVKTYSPSNPKYYTDGFDVCNRLSNTQFIMELENYGIDNNFTLETKNMPQWIKISEKSFSLTKGESKKIYFDIDSTQFRYEQKTYTFEVKIRNNFGSIEKTQIINLYLKDCYGHSIKIVDGNSFNTCDYESYSYDVEVYNSGSKKQVVDLGIENGGDFTLSSDSIVLESGETKTIKLYLNGDSERKTYNSKIFARLESGFIEYADFKVENYDSETCHALVFQKDSFKVNYDTSSINVQVQDKSVEPGYYTVSWDGSIIADIEQDDIYVDSKGKMYDINLALHTKGLSEGVYNGTIILENDAFTYSRDISITLKDKSAFTKAFEFLAFGNVCRQFSLVELFAILAVILLIIAFMIWGPKYPYKFMNRVKLKMPVLVMLICLFLLGLLFVIVLSGLPQTNAQVYNITTNASQLRFEWLENDKYTLDVASFFKDPDANTITFKVSDIENMKTSVKGSMITFHPDIGFSGIRKATVTAFDEYGGSVTSPSITLSVLPKQRKSAAEIYSIYCWYINLALFAIILVLIFIAVVVKQKKRSRK